VSRKILFYGDYFLNFYKKQAEKSKVKIDYVMNLIANVDRVPDKFLKHIEGTEGLYEIRAQAGKNIFRIFCFFDENKLLIVLNAFQKKTEKTPKDEIALAERLKRKYFIDKSKGE